MDLTLINYLTAPMVFAMGFLLFFKNTRSVNSIALLIFFIGSALVSFLTGLAYDLGGIGKLSESAVIVKLSGIFLLLVLFVILRLALTYPFERKRLKTTLVFAFIWVCLSLIIILTDFYLIKVEQRDGIFYRVEGKFYPVFSLIYIVLSLASVIIFLVRRKESEQKVIKTHLTVMAFGLLTAILFGILISVVIPYFYNNYMIYPLNSLGIIGIGIVLYTTNRFSGIYLGTEKTSLKRKAVFFITLILIFFTSFGILLNTISYRNKLHSSMQEDLLSIGSMIIRSISGGIQLNVLVPPKGFSEELDSLKKINLTISYIYILSPRQDIIYYNSNLPQKHIINRNEIKPEDFFRLLNNNRFYEMVYPLNDRNNARIGTLHIGKHKAVIGTEILKYVLSMVIIYGSSLVIALFILLLFVTRKITEPLSTLSREMQDVAQNLDFSINPLSLKGNDEIAELTKTFNLMLSKIKDYASSLENKNKIISRQFSNSIHLVTSLIASSSTRLYQYTESVAKISVLLAKKIGLDQQKVEIAALLHDLGMMGKIERLFFSKKSLTEDEVNIIKTHPLKSADIFNYLEGMDDIRTIILQHHEHFDGTGYPYGLKGNEIVLEARILKLVDSFVEMLTKREFQTLDKKERIIHAISRGRGKEFDPVLVEYLINLILENNLIYVVNEKDIKHYTADEVDYWEIPSNLHFESKVVEKVMQKISSFIKDSELLFNIDFSLTEVVRNAIIHGNQYKEDKMVTISLEIADNYFKQKTMVIKVEDEGDGMDIDEHNRFSNSRKMLFSFIEEFKKLGKQYQLENAESFKYLINGVNAFRESYYTDFNSFRQMEGSVELSGGLGLLYVKKTFDNVEFRNVVNAGTICGTEVTMEKILPA